MLKVCRPFVQSQLLTKTRPNLRFLATVRPPEQHSRNDPPLTPQLVGAFWPSNVTNGNVLLPATPAKLPRGRLESRLETALAELSVPGAPPSAAVRQGHLALLKRWYYRPGARRAGEIFFPDGENRWPAKAILRGIGHVAAKRISV